METYFVEKKVTRLTCFFPCNDRGGYVTRVVNLTGSTVIDNWI